MKSKFPKLDKLFGNNYRPLRQAVNETARSVEAIPIPSDSAADLGELPARPSTSHAFDMASLPPGLSPWGWGMIVTDGETVFGATWRDTWEGVQDLIDSSSEGVDWQVVAAFWTLATVTGTGIDEIALVQSNTEVAAAWVAAHAQGVAMVAVIQALAEWADDVESLWTSGTAGTVDNAMLRERIREAKENLTELREQFAKLRNITEH